MSTKSAAAAASCPMTPPPTPSNGSSGPVCPGAPLRPRRADVAGVFAPIKGLEERFKLAGLCDQESDLANRLYQGKSAPQWQAFVRKLDNATEAYFLILNLLPGLGLRPPAELKNNMAATVNWFCGLTSPTSQTRSLV